MSSTQAFDAEAGELEQPGEPPIGARRLLALEEQREALLETELRQIGDAALFVEGLGHSGESKTVEECERLLNQHGGESVRVRSDVDERVGAVSATR